MINADRSQGLIEPRDAFERGVSRWCHRHDLLPTGKRIVVAVSGGPDSTALLLALSTLMGTTARGRLVVAHLDHGLRGARGAADARFVRRLAGRLGLRARLGSTRIRRGPGGSLESAARDARYRFLSRIAARVGADRVAVGHTADDQAETVLHRLCRGCGIRGASAMSPDRPLSRNGALRLVRPLLGTTRRAVLDYLRRVKATSREDETNRRPIWTRNRIRTRILPMLDREIHPGASRAIARFAGQAAQASALVSDLADDAEARVVASRTAGRIEIRSRRMDGLPDAVRTEIWHRLLGRLGPDTSASHAEIEALESVLRDGDRCASLRGGRILARRGKGKVRIEVRRCVRPSAPRRRDTSR